MKNTKSTFKLTLISCAISSFFVQPSLAAENDVSIEDKIKTAIAEINKLPNALKTLKVVDEGKQEATFAITQENNKSIYVQNFGQLNGVIKVRKGSEPNPVIIVENHGKMNLNLGSSNGYEPGINVSATKLYFHNTETAFVPDYAYSATLKNADEVYVKNDGTFSSIRPDNSKHIEIENTGTLDSIYTKGQLNNNYIINSSVVAETVIIKNTKDITYINVSGNQFDIENKGTIEQLGVTGLKGKVTNTGTIKNLTVSDYSARHYVLPKLIEDIRKTAPELLAKDEENYLSKVENLLYSYSSSTETNPIYHFFGIKSEEDLKALHKDTYDKLTAGVKADSGVVELHLENGTVGELYLSRNGRDDKQPDQANLDYIPPTKIFINKDTKIDTVVNFNSPVYFQEGGMDVEDFDDDDSLVLVGESTDLNPELINKFKGIANLRVESPDWSLGNHSFNFAKNITVDNNSTLRLTGDSDSKLSSQNFIIEPAGTLVVERDYLIDSNLINKGNIQFGSNKTLSEEKAATDVHTLTVGKNYVGENGLITMRVNVEKAPILHDTLVINGEASGNSRVRLEALGSSKLKVRTKEKATLIQTESSAHKAFKLDKSQFGLYRYILNPMVENGKTNWVLEQRYFAGVGNVLASINSAQNFLVHSYYDRTGAAKNHSGVWTSLNYQKSKANILGSDSQIGFNADRQSLQIGYDIVNVEENGKRFTYGAYLNYGVEKGKAKFADDPTVVSNKLTGYGLGMYASLLKDNWYVDSWLSYNWFNNKLSGEDIAMTYKMKGFHASLELGYRHLVNWNQYQIAIQPQWQGIYHYLPLFNVPELEGLSVKHRNTLTSRLGLRLSLASEAQQFKPFVELNWLHRNKPNTLQVEDESFTLQGDRNVAEVKLGLEQFNIGKNLALSGYVSQHLGKKDYKNSRVELRLNYKF